MNWKPFHHPDWSLPVVARRAAGEWLDILDGIGEVLASQGRSVLWKNSYPSSTAYYTAMSRLRKNGLVVRVDAKNSLPRLILTEKAKASRPAYYHPETLWNSGWNGIWYTLIFDVPEANRGYRDTLRRFLKTLRMGCLQKSVWITPRDIRPEYDDLERAAAVNTVAYLLESRAVLRRDQQEMVQAAWNFPELHRLQARYLEVFEENLELLRRPSHAEEDLVTLLYQESRAYAQAMVLDPLLPKELFPADYLGPKVWALHNKLRASIAKSLG